MLVCTLDGDLYPPLEEPTGTDPKSKKKDKDKDKKFVWNHGSKLINIPTQQTIEEFELKSHVSADVEGDSASDWLSHFSFANSGVLVRSHLPAEEHTQAKISEDCKKEGCDIIFYSIRRSPPILSPSF